DFEYFISCLLDRYSQVVSNTHCRQLSGDAGADAAIRTLETRLAAWSVTERMGDLIAVMLGRLGHEVADLRIARVNESPIADGPGDWLHGRRPRNYMEEFFREQPARMRDRLIEANQEDLRLFAW